MFNANKRGYNGKINSREPDFLRGWASADHYRANAHAVADKITKATAGSYHSVQCQINKEAKYPRGQQFKGMLRTPLSYEYLLDIRIDVDTDAFSFLLLEVGCFVLICNLSYNRELIQWTAASLLVLYKNQSGIEQNFFFLKLLLSSTGSF